MVVEGPPVASESLRGRAVVVVVLTWCVVPSWLEELAEGKRSRGFGFAGVCQPEMRMSMMKGKIACDHRGRSSGWRKEKLWRSFTAADIDELKWSRRRLDWPEMSETPPTLLCRSIRRDDRCERIVIHTISFDQGDGSITVGSLLSFLVPGRLEIARKPGPS